MKYLYNIISTKNNYFGMYNKLKLFNGYTNNFNQKFYISLAFPFVFKKYINNYQKFSKCGNEIEFEFDYLAKYFLDGFSDLKKIEINKKTKFVENNIFRKFDIFSIKINLEWLNMFNEDKIRIITLNDTIIELNLNLFNKFTNIEKLEIPLTFRKIKGFYIALKH